MAEEDAVMEPGLIILPYGWVIETRDERGIWWVCKPEAGLLYSMPPRSEIYSQASIDFAFTSRN